MRFFLKISFLAISIILFGFYNAKSTKIQSIISRSNNNSQIDTNTSRFFGEWIPYKNEPCDIGESHDFESYMKLKVYIYSNKVIVFNDTVYSPIFKVSKESVGMIECRIAWEKLDITTDSINILSVGSGVDFIISGKNNLIVEDGKGVMFFLKRAEKATIKK
ncbi:MAG TPA: hypothetical protein VNG53_00065 [Bacteroidia bacterium]|nr:hypothetical protein [Bacteroidia bacterium]